MERCSAMGVVVDRLLAGRLIALLDRLALEPQNLTAIDALDEGVDRHLADSLAALSVPEVASGTSLLDLGSGAGFPGLPLAMARPELATTLVESERRKAAWLDRASADARNVRVVDERSELLARSEPAAWDVVAARALAPLPVALELAAPLTAQGGHVVLWRAGRSADEETAGARAAQDLGLVPRAVHRVHPFPEADRHLHVYEKVAPTPSRFPRRAGRAAKRPLA